MGKKLANGHHTRVPVSPSGPPRNEYVWNDGDNMTHNGYVFAWDSAQGLYKARIPPPPATPPGEWVYVEFEEDESYDTYEAQQTGTDVWTETGQDYANG